jgi:CDP-4-dehydro-6-deoxyglucose reductase
VAEPTRALTVRALAAVAPDVVAIELAVPAPGLDVVPGQHLRLLLAGERRSYSIVSPGGRRDALTLLVRRRGRAAAMLDGLHVGDVVEAEGPRGGYRLAADHPGDVAFVATGVGLAPILPMLEQAIARGGAGRLRLWWGVERPVDVFWAERLADAARDRRVAIEIVAATTDGPLAPRILAALPDLTAPTFYLCGHRDRIAAVRDALVAAGVEPARILTEAG